MAEEKKGFKFPSAYTILIILIILVANLDLTGFKNRSGFVCKEA
jgi:hypothetical protein